MYHTPRIHESAGMKIASGVSEVLDCTIITVYYTVLNCTVRSTVDMIHSTEKNKNKNFSQGCKRFHKTSATKDMQETNF